MTKSNATTRGQANGQLPTRNFEKHIWLLAQHQVATLLLPKLSSALWLCKNVTTRWKQEVKDGIQAKNTCRTVFRTKMDLLAFAIC